MFPLSAHPNWLKYKVVSSSASSHEVLCSQRPQRNGVKERAEIKNLQTSEQR